jgi:hypothetical protein
MLSDAISAAEVTLQRLMGFEGEKRLVSNDMGGDVYCLGICTTNLGQWLRIQPKRIATITVCSVESGALRAVL